MVSSEDEAECGPTSVSNYYFEDETDHPVSFVVLPIQWSRNESPIGDRKCISLRGTADNGLQTVHKDVTSWKFDLTNVIPEISVFSKDKKWIKLLKPRKSFEEIIRSILITVHCLSYAKRNPEASEKPIWDHLSKSFSFYVVRPSQNDLVEHMDLIREALERDESLAKAKFLVKFLEEKPVKKIYEQDVQKTMDPFIVDDSEDILDDVGNEDEEDELFDTACAICDNGGELLCCDGRCLRSFHPTVDADNTCKTLGLAKEEVDAIQEFFCKNCEYKQHQCYACGKLGSSDKDKDAEVFICASATCGHFYHSNCVSKLLHCDDEMASENLQKSIAEGGSFTCPLHKCHVCKGGENKLEHDLQFAVCRRCPKAYHRKCLPRKIAFEDNEEEGLITRAWEDLLPNRRILIYCLKHEILDDLGTPNRNHVQFPLTEEEKAAEEKKKQKAECALRREKLGPMKSSKDSSQSNSAEKTSMKFPSITKQVETTKVKGRLSDASKSSRNLKAVDVSRTPMKKNMKYGSVGADGSSTLDAMVPSLGEQLFDHMTKKTELRRSGKRDTQNIESATTATETPARRQLSTDLPALDANDEKRLMDLMRDAAASVNLDEVQKKYRMPSTHSYSLKSYIDKIKFGRVEGSVAAVQTALKKLEEEKCSIEDAKAVCAPEVLDQICRWKNKLKVYLAPFLHGTRYTSFGRHFTKVEKLQIIVDRLHYYVQDGDMIVDFCCGANDFSCLMRRKLEGTGKKCLYKNYDIIPPKNDFNFEKRDWITVKPGELASGSRLIMGLNPPFGVKAYLANVFIDKALEFNPKLLILIVPPETERLEKKKPAYDLIWEDEQFLSGTSFYLPGTIAENDKEMDQWNYVSPPLSLWSRRDWTLRHKAIAEKHSHILDGCEEANAGDTSMLDNLPLQNNEGEKLGSTSTQGQNERSPGRKSEKDSQDSDGSRKNLPSNDERKRKYDEVYRDSEMSSKASGDRLSDGRDSRLETQTAKDARKRKYSNDGHGSEGSGGDKQSDGGHPEGDHYGSIPYNSPSYVTDVRPLGEGQPSRCFEMPSHGGFTDKGDLDFVRSSNIEFRTASAEVQSLIPGDMGWASGTMGKSPVEEQSGGRHQGADIYFGDVRRSPPNLLDRSSTEVHTSGYPSISGSHRTAFGGTQLSAIDEMERRFSQSNSDPYGSYRYSGVNTAEQFMGRGRGTADNRGYRSSGDVDLDIRSQLALYGQDPAAASDPIFSQLESLPSSASTLHLGSSAPASYRNMSVMQRYTPQLHDLNSPMTSNYRFEPQMQVLNPHVSNNFRFDPPQPQMGDLNYFNDPMGLAPSYPADPFATAPAPPPPPPYPFSHPGFSPGWIND